MMMMKKKKILSCNEEEKLSNIHNTIFPTVRIDNNSFINNKNLLFMLDLERNITESGASEIKIR